ncbi:hypothetical protein O181_121179, partial [Austropuccinia psidii MF-1]|nr:hypothetical protein [Austropuccinia psidii MF-1]
MLVKLANKHARNVCLLSAPSDHAARSALALDALARTPLWSTMMKAYLSANGHRDPKQADGNRWRWQEDIWAWADCHHVLSPMGLKCQNSAVPSLPRKQTPWQPTPGPSGTQWSEQLFREPSQTKEPPIPGPSPSSKPPEDVLPCEPEPEVAPMQSMEEPF